MELVSGPDVGGGFLFQLTSEAAGELTRFTTHIQEGGIDGGEPTAGSPETIGFKVSERPCAIGGRHCWHREVESPTSHALRARFAYNRLRFVIGPMIRQHEPSVAVPFASGVREVARRIAAPLDAAHQAWMIGGSAAPALWGAAVEPRDLDLSTTREGVEVIAEALGEYLIEPPGRSRWGPGAARWGARAFVGTFKDGLRVEWAEATPDGDAAPGPGAEWSEGVLSQALRTPLDEWLVPVAAPEFGLVKSLLRADDSRTAAILELTRTRGLDRRLVDRLVDGYTADPARRSAWRARIYR